MTRITISITLYYIVANTYSQGERDRDWDRDGRDSGLRSHLSHKCSVLYN